ncbi:hypothetical protein [Pseudomonas aeruginosa]|uniref:hypothetical protein n=1 Tax=Pseudomonas aeruginosa TaxID=287 RepID=UPI001C8B61BE|nr:hypothetical protein [Pseudomonas aeruginosa]
MKRKAFDLQRLGIGDKAIGTAMYDLLATLHLALKSAGYRLLDKSRASWIGVPMDHLDDFGLKTLRTIAVDIELDSFTGMHTKFIGISGQSHCSHSNGSIIFARSCPGGSTYEPRRQRFQLTYRSGLT